PTGVDVFLTEVGVAVGIALDPLLGRGGLSRLLRRLWRLGLFAGNQKADANKHQQRQSRRCRNSRLHKCLRLTKWPDRVPTQVKGTRALYPLNSRWIGNSLKHHPVFINR